MEILSGLFETVKSWLYKCSSVILVISFFAVEFPKTLGLIATWSIIGIFATDILIMIVGFIQSIVSGEWSALGVFSSLISLLTLAFSIGVYFLGVAFLKDAGIIVTTNGFYGELQWAGICVIVWHFIEEILSLPISIISLFADGEYN